MESPKKTREPIRLFTPMIIQTYFSYLTNLAEETTRATTYQCLRALRGSYPNLFIHLTEDRFSDFNKKLASVKSEEDWQAILEQYAIRRTNSHYWEYSDYFNNKWLNLQPLKD